MGYRMLFRLIALLLVPLLVVMGSPGARAALAQVPPVSVVVDGQRLDTEAFIIDGRTLVPLRAIFEALGAAVAWDGAIRTVTATKGRTVVRLTIDQPEARVNGQPVVLAVPAQIINERTYVPVRFVSEALGAQVSFDNDTRTVHVVTGAGAPGPPGGAGSGSGGAQPGPGAPGGAGSGSGGAQPGPGAPGGAGSGSGGAGSGAPGAPPPAPAAGPAGGCKPQQHSGTIKPEGETWGICGSPHLVTGIFRVEGPGAPVLTVEAGAVVRFAKGAGLTVGQNGPGGLLVQGDADLPAEFTSAEGNPQPGAWRGIAFRSQTVPGKASVRGAVLRYAGYDYYDGAAIYVEKSAAPREVLLRDVTLFRSLGAGVLLHDGARLAAGSGGLTISGTRAGSIGRGAPIVADAMGAGTIPPGRYLGNDLNAVLIATAGSGTSPVTANTTWGFTGVPYAASVNVLVAGPARPTLTISPGVAVFFAADRGLTVGEREPGTLVADATAGAPWPESYDHLLLSGLQVARLAGDMAKKDACLLCWGPGPEPDARGKPVVFGPWTDKPVPGFWNGIRLLDRAGTGSKLVGAVVAYGGKKDDLGAFRAAIYADSTYGGGKSEPVRLLLARSLVAGSAGSGLGLYGDAQLLPGSTGNWITGNSRPVRAHPNAVGSIPPGNRLTGNYRDWISVWSVYSKENVTASQTWRDPGVPLYLETSPVVGGGSTLTLAPGARLAFREGRGLVVGDSSAGQGSLQVQGAQANPVVFTSARQVLAPYHDSVPDPGEQTFQALNWLAHAPGPQVYADHAPPPAALQRWTGIQITQQAGSGTQINGAVIEYANNAVELARDLGPVLMHSTLSNNLAGVRAVSGSTDLSATCLGVTFQENTEIATRFGTAAAFAEKRIAGFTVQTGYAETRNPDGTWTGSGKLILPAGGTVDAMWNLSSSGALTSGTFSGTFSVAGRTFTVAAGTLKDTGLHWEGSLALPGGATVILKLSLGNRSGLCGYGTASVGVNGQSLPFGVILDSAGQLTVKWNGQLRLGDRWVQTFLELAPTGLKGWGRVPLAGEERLFDLFFDGKGQFLQGKANTEVWLAGRPVPVALTLLADGQLAAAGTATVTVGGTPLPFALSVVPADKLIGTWKGNLELSQGFLTDVELVLDAPGVRGKGTALVQGVARRFDLTVDAQGNLSGLHLLAAPLQVAGHQVTGNLYLATNGYIVAETPFEHVVDGVKMTFYVVGDRVGAVAGQVGASVVRVANRVGDAAWRVSGLAGDAVVRAGQKVSRSIYLAADGAVSGTARVLMAGKEYVFNLAEDAGGRLVGLYEGAVDLLGLSLTDTHFTLTLDSLKGGGKLNILGAQFFINLSVAADGGLSGETWADVKPVGAPVWISQARLWVEGTTAGGSGTLMFQNGAIGNGKFSLDGKGYIRGTGDLKIGGTQLGVSFVVGHLYYYLHGSTTVRAEIPGVASFHATTSTAVDTEFKIKVTASGTVSILGQSISAGGTVDLGTGEITLSVLGMSLTFDLF